MSAAVLEPLPPPPPPLHQLQTRCSTGRYQLVVHSVSIPTQLYQPGQSGAINKAIQLLSRLRKRDVLEEESQRRRETKGEGGGGGEKAGREVRDICVAGKGHR